MGLPGKIAAQLRATPKIETLGVNSVVRVSRALMSDVQSGDSMELGAAARNKESILYME